MRKDILEYVRQEKGKGIKINYAKVARQYGCDYRTVKKYYEKRIVSRTMQVPLLPLLTYSQFFDYGLVLSEGLTGIIARIGRYLETCGAEQRAFYTACRSGLNAVIAHSNAYAAISGIVRNCEAVISHFADRHNISLPAFTTEYIYSQPTELKTQPAFRIICMSVVERILHLPKKT